MQNNNKLNELINNYYLNINNLNINNISSIINEELDNINENILHNKINKENKIKNQINNNYNINNKNKFNQLIIVKGDIIHNNSELVLITNKIKNKTQKLKLTLNLLYKATYNSDKADAFHAKKKKKKSSIVLVETTKGKRFGGFTSCNWKGNCIDKFDEEAFLFSLDKMKTYDNIPGEEAIGCYPTFGPVFLGCQIRIYDNAFTKGGSTFERGNNFDTEEDYELTGGDRLFDVKEIEVYEVVFE